MLTRVCPFVFSSVTLNNGHTPNLKIHSTTYCDVPHTLMLHIITTFIRKKFTNFKALIYLVLEELRANTHKTRRCANHSNSSKV